MNKGIDVVRRQAFWAGYKLTKDRIDIALVNKLVARIGNIDDLELRQDISVCEAQFLQGEKAGILYVAYLLGIDEQIESKVQELLKK